MATSQKFFSSHDHLNNPGLICNSIGATHPAILSRCPIIRIIVALSKSQAPSKFEVSFDHKLKETMLQTRRFDMSKYPGGLLRCFGRSCS